MATTPPQHPGASDTMVSREQLKDVLRNAGLLVEPSPATLESAAQSTLTLADATEILSRGAGPSFSQQVAMCVISHP